MTKKLKPCVRCELALSKEEREAGRICGDCKRFLHNVFHTAMAVLYPKPPKKTWKETRVERNKTQST